MPRRFLPVVALLPLTLIGTALPAVAATPPTSFTFNGAGWGHGVGMSQYGAYGQALEGRTSKQILEHYYNPAKVSTSSANSSSDIKVQLVGGITSTTITPKDGQLRVRWGNQLVATSSAATFTQSGTSIKAVVNGKTYTVAGTTGFTVEWQNTRYWASGTANTTVSIPKTNGSSTGVYRHGKITVKTLSSKLNVVNSLRLNDEYLYGLAEMPSSWPVEALEAQAIAGRTYAFRNMTSTKSNCDCNVYDEVQSQKFTGWVNENEGANGVWGKRWKSAVDGTLSRSNGVPVSGQVVMHNGALIDAVYFSSSGGKTRSGKDVWGGETAYLQSRDDRWSVSPAVKNSNSSWSYTITQAKAASGYKLPNVASISVKKNADGTVASSTAKSTTGKTATLTAAQTRSLFGVKAAWVSSITSTGGTVPAPTLPPSESVQSSRTPVVATAGKSPVIAKAPVSKSPATKAPVAKASTTKSPAAKKASSASKSTVKASSTTMKTTHNLNLRKGASTAKAVISVIPRGAQVVATGKTSGKWKEVRFKSMTGWSHGDYLRTAKATKNTSVKSATTTHNLNMRVGAGMGHKITLTIPKGSSVKLTGKTSGAWKQVEFKGKTGWSVGTYLR